jgi:hypothetical protein
LANFIRRFLADPGNETLLDIESVNILDLEPPASIAGVGTGTALLVAEFEDGPFAADSVIAGGGPSEVSGAGDLLTRFGGFGYTYGGVQGNNPCARTRFADGALTPEHWNGNGFIALANKRFKNLIVARADTSVGSVEFTRQAAVLGSNLPTFALNPGDVLSYFYGDDTAITTFGGTFNAAAAVYTTGNGVYPTTFVGGEKMVITIDQGTPRQVGPVTVTFTAADQTHAQVVARINAALGFTCAAVALLTTTFTSRVVGTSANVNIVSADALVLTALNAVVGVTSGTGSVADITAVTMSEVNIVAGSIGNVAFDRDAGGNLRMHAVAGSGITLLGCINTTFSFAQATGLGFDLGAPQISATQISMGAMSDQPNGFGKLVTNTGTYPTLFAGGETLTLGVDSGPNVTVLFTALDQTAAQVAARINAAMGFACMTNHGAYNTFSGRVNGGNFRVVGGVASALLAVFGFLPGDVPLQYTANANVAMSIPAGTRVRNATAQEWVTMQTISVAAGNAGPYSVRVRPSTDDGTAGSAAVSTLTVIPFPIPNADFTVTNPVGINAALTDAAIDAAYIDAINTTTNLNSVAKLANFIWSARASNAVRNALRQNVIDASANGCFGRMTVIRPPLGTTTRAIAEGPVAPGVNAYRDQRVVYAFPGVQTFISQIARLGLAGGAGFTADGVLDVPFDGFEVSCMSQLPPEENPGQDTPYMAGAIGIEANNPDVQNLTIEDYISFRANGIAAPRIDDGVMTIQSGVTSVDPSVFPNLRNIARRRMADFIEDTLANRLKSFGKKLNSRLRRIVITSEVNSFMSGLVNGNRIDGYLLDSKSGNTAETLALGIFRLILKVRSLSSLDSIVLETTVGESVNVAEAA